MKLSVQIIGSGTWGTKVHKLLSTNGIKSTQVSAREFLKNPEKSLEKKEFIWSCTLPNQQYAILERLQKKKYNTIPKIILEKPFAVDKKQADNLHGYIAQDNLRLFFSAPWSHSEIWASARKLIEQSKLPISITIVRGGNKRRNAFSPAQDWIIHDLMLLANLEVFFGRLTIYKVENSVYSETRKLFGSFESDVDIKIVGGYMNTHQALWCITSRDDVMIVDFENAKIKVKKSNETCFFDNSNSILRMLFTFESMSQNNPSLARVIELEETLYSIPQKP